MFDYWLISALVIGFLGSLHCVGMCGGIASFITWQTQVKKGKLLPLLIFNLGRITTYTILGLIFGYIGLLTFSGFKNSVNLQMNLYISAIMFILLGLYISQLWKGITIIEKPGLYIYKKIQPWSKKLLPITNYKQLFLYGLSWGLLPCGMVYSALLISISLTNIFKSTSYMLFFGLGTLPAMLITPYSINKLRNFINHTPIRLFLGLAFIISGILLILYTNSPQTHQHYH